MNEPWFPRIDPDTRAVVSWLALVTAVTLALVFLVPGCTGDGATVTDASPEAQGVDVTPAEQPYAIAHALTAAKPTPPDPPKPGPVVVAPPGSPEECGWYYWQCVGWCYKVPAVLACQAGCWREYQVCLGFVGPLQ